MVLDGMVGHLAFDLARYGEATGQARRHLLICLLHAPPLDPFFQDARQYQEKMRQKLEYVFALSLEELAVVLVLWSVPLGTPIPSRFLALIAQRLGIGPPALQAPQEVAREWQQFFDDMFAHPGGGLDEERIQRVGEKLGEDRGMQ